RVFDRLARQPPAARIVVEGEVLAGDREFDARRIMIAQILADAAQLVHRRDAARTEQLALPDAGQLQQFRRIDRTARDDHFARRPRFAPHARYGIAHADAA